MPHIDVIRTGELTVQRKVVPRRGGETVPNGLPGSLPGLNPTKGT